MKENHYKLKGYLSTNRSNYNLKAHLILADADTEKIARRRCGYFYKVCA